MTFKRRTPESSTFKSALLFLGSGSLVSMALQLVRGKVAALLLAPAGFGIYNQLAAIWNLIALFGSLGMRSGFVHHIAVALANGQRKFARSTISTLVITGIFAGLVLTVILAVFARSITRAALGDTMAQPSYVLVLAIASPIAVSVVFYQALVAAQRDIRGFTTTQMVSEIFGAVLFVALIYFFGVLGSAFSLVAGSLLLLIMLLRHLWPSSPDLIVPRRHDFDPTILRQNLPFAMTNLVLVSSSSLATLIVGGLIIARLGEAANGILATGLRLSGVYLSAVTAAAASYFLPHLSASTDQEADSREIDNAIGFYLLALPLLMAGLIVLARPVIFVLMSYQFTSAAILLAIFVPAELCRVLAETVGTVTLSKGRLLNHTWPFLTFVVVFVAGSFLTIDRFGLVGAAASYLVGHVVHFLTSMAVARFALGVRLRRETKVLAALAVIGLLLLGAAVHIGGAFLAACACVAISFWVFYASRTEHCARLAGHIVRLRKT